MSCVRTTKIGKNVINNDRWSDTGVGWIIKRRVLRMEQTNKIPCIVFSFVDTKFIDCYIKFYDVNTNVFLFCSCFAFQTN